MAEFDIVAIPTKATYVSFDNLHVGQSSQQIVGRLLRFWNSYNNNNKEEFLGITVLLLDEKDSMIHGFIPANLVTMYADALQENKIFELYQFKVHRCTNHYKVTGKPIAIRFHRGTQMNIIPDEGLKINRGKFNLANFDHLQALANTNLALPDVLGQIISVQGPNLKDPTLKDRLIVKLKLNTSIIAYLNIWDDAASNFRSYMSSTSDNMNVMVVTTVNPTLFQGRLYLNSTEATKYYFDKNIEEIQKFTNEMGIEEGASYGHVETKEGVRKKEMVTIAQLQDYQANANEQSQEVEFQCNAKIIRVLRRAGWTYNACTNCDRNLGVRSTLLKCNTCDSPNTQRHLRFRVELAVHDGENPTTFIVRDNEIKNLINKSPTTLLEEMGRGGHTNNFPTSLSDLEENNYMFEIRVPPLKYPPKYNKFTVTNITTATTTNNPTTNENNKRGPNFIEDKPTTSKNNSNGGKLLKSG